jgi:hypothetical protein
VGPDRVNLINGTAAGAILGGGDERKKEDGVNIKIRIIENMENGRKWCGIVSKNQLSKIYSHQNAGGFLRYSIDEIDFTSQNPSRRVTGFVHSVLK